MPVSREFYFWACLSDNNFSAYAIRAKRLEKVSNHACPRCGRPELNIYYSDQTDNRVGAWCESCNLKAYYFGEELVSINS